MNEPVLNPADGAAEAGPADARQELARPPARQPFVRGGLARSALFILVLAGGYYAGRYARNVYLDRTAAGDRAAMEEQAPAADQASPAAPAMVVDPEASLPASVQALYDETLAAVDVLVQLVPDNVDALEMKARVHIWLGNSSQAELMWQECLKRDPQYIHAYVGMAAAAAARAEHEKSLELAQRALETDPPNFQARAIAADALLQLGRAEEVPAMLEAHLAGDPRSRGHFLLGQAYAQLGDNAKARANFAAAVRIFPDYVEAYSGLAAACDKLGETDQAREALDKFRELSKKREADPSRVREDVSSDLGALQREASVFFTDMGRVLYVGQKIAEAEQVWLRAAALDDQNVVCRQSLAWLCRNAHRRGENIAWLKQLAALEPANPSYWIEIGHVYSDLLLMPAAEEAFRQARRVAPENGAACAALADLLLRTGQKLTETVELSRQAVQHQPSAANYAMLAAACQVTRDLDGARTAIDEALKLAPHNETYRAARESIDADRQSNE